MVAPSPSSISQLQACAPEPLGPDSEEYPDVGSFPERDLSSAAETFISRHDSTKARASRFPRLLIEIDRQEAAGIVSEQGIDANSDFAREVLIYDLVSERQVVVWLCPAFFSAIAAGSTAPSSRRSPPEHTPTFRPLFSHRTANTSSRPRNRERNKAIFSATEGSERVGNAGVGASAALVPLVGSTGSLPCPVPASNFRRRVFSSCRRSHSAVALANCSERLSNSATTGIIAKRQGDTSGGKVWREAHKRPPHLHFRVQDAP